ncbi:MAG: hypothetical protein JW882_03675 [Deltaproteobacteria bacterium]|nr:hypothetical protein [Deltaproteobacteria bacterium]
MKRADFDEKAILSQLEELANSLGVEVRYEKIQKESSFFPGGLCTIHGKKILIINSLASSEDKISIFIKSVKDFDLNEIFIRPALRELIAGYQG